jgi:Rap1a immunity proteins
MKKPVPLFFIGFLICSSSVLAQTTYTTGNDLKPACVTYVGQHPADRGEALKAGVCMGFIDGWLQLATMIKSQLSEELFCPPKGVTNRQVIDIAVKYMNDHPEKLHQPAAQILYDAVSDAFPCPAKPAK